MPDNEGAQPAQSKTLKKESAADSGLEGALLWLVKSGPRWARIPAITVTILATLSSPILMIRNQLFAPQNKEETLDRKAPEASQLDMATTGKAASDEKVVEDSISNSSLSPEQRQKMQLVFRKLRHELEHLNNPKDAVAWTIFAKKSPQDYFGYKVFPSDACLLIARVEQGQGTSEWLTDPNRPIPGSSPPNSSSPTPADGFSPKLPQLHFKASNPVSLNDDPLTRFGAFELNSSYGERLDLERSSSSVDKTPVQGSCLNPHPWNFAGAWGQPINQCQQPFYRQWADGCSHVQIFDHCQNIWGPIVWQYCAAYHHP